MKKKIMLLIAIIPLVFMLTIFSVGKVVSVVVSIPVSGIKITTQNDEGMISLDMATYSDDLYLKAEVYPSNAKNKAYSVSVAGIGDEEAADISVEENGRVRLHGTGRAKLTVTSNENAYSDSVVLNVVSSKVIDFTPVLRDDNGLSTLTPSNEAGVDYEIPIESGDLLFGAEVNPSTLSESPVKWYSENEELLTVNEFLGKARAQLSGSVIVTAVNDDGIKGRIEKKIKLNISRAATASGITVNGGENVTVVCPTDGDYATLMLDIPNGKTADDITVSGDNVKGFELIPVNGSATQFKAVLEFIAPTDCTVRVSADGERYNEAKIEFSDYAFGVYTSYHLSDDDVMYHKDGVTATYIAAGNLYDGAVSYSFSSSDESVFTVVQDGYTARVTAHKTGEATLTATAYKNGAAIGEPIIKTIRVISPVSSVEFAANAASLGIGDMLAVGDTVVSGNGYVSSPAELGLLAQNGTESVAFDAAAFTYTSSDESVATPRASLIRLRVNTVSTGKVTFTAKWIYADYFGEKVSASLAFKAVKNGVSVNNYADLKKATDDGKAVVLTDNVMLGEKTRDYNLLRGYAHTMPTTWDWQFYENSGKPRPEVYYLIEFKNDVYGNGYELNGDNITQAKDGTGSPLLFKGPLDFVSISVAAVKGQDNVVFLARTAGVTIDNVVLNGCSNDSLKNENGEFDLSLLNYTGTTLEVAESVNVKNCRVSNGRTVMRVYGGKTTDGKPVVADVAAATASEERITVNIESCILTNAREFILKTGSNRALLAADVNNNEFYLPKLPRATEGVYEPFDDANRTNEYFYDKYVIADITLKNSVLSTSGLFSIGMEAHFGGQMLAGSSITNWKKLAATSYACVLRLEGDVRLLDWKKLDNVDSSTLIETTGDLGENKQFLQLNINAMLDKVSANPQYNDIVTRMDGENFVHGGIALYGGGYNYSYVDFSGLSDDIERLTRYDVSLSVLKEGEPENSSLYLQGSLLPAAAGPAPFRFYMYNSSSNTDYQSQTDAIKNGDAYKIPSAK